MKRMQKMLSIILSAILAVSLCCAAPMTASAQEDAVSQALAAATEGADDYSPVEMVKSMYKIITIMLTIDGLDIPQTDLDAINQALALAKPVVDNPDATELEIQTAAMALTSAMAVLMPYMESVGDEISPQAVLVVCETVRMAIKSGMMTDLTDEQITALEMAVDAAESVANDPTSSPEDLQNAMDALMEAIESVSPDYPLSQEEMRNELLFEIDEIKEERDLLTILVTEKDTDAIIAITKEMNAIAGQDEITQADYDYAQELYFSAYDLLNKYYTRENLKRVIDYAYATIETGEYTEESVGRLQTVIDDAQAIYDDETADDLDIMSAIQEVLMSTDELERIVVEEPTEEPTGAPTDAPTNGPTNAPTSTPTSAPTKAPTSAPTAAGTTDGKPVNTGDNSQTAVVTLTLVMLTAAAFVIISRKKRETA